MENQSKAVVPAQATGVKDARSAAAYVLTLVTGLAVFWTVGAQDRTRRWHAWQAIGLGLAFVVLFPLLTYGPSVVWSALRSEEVLADRDWNRGVAIAATTVGYAINLFWILFVALIVVLAVKAYGGRTLRLPWVSRLADRLA